MFYRMKGVGKMKTWHYALLVLLGGCSYGALSTFVKLAYSAGFSRATVTGSQFLMGTLLIWIVALFSKKKKLTLPKIGKLLLSGVPLGLTSLFYYQSLQSLNASLAIIFLFQFVWIGSLFEWFFYKKKPTKGKIVSIAILVIGSILASGIIAEGSGEMTWQGTIWGMLSALTYTTFIFLSSSVEKDTPVVQKGALFTTGGMITVFILNPPTELLHLPVLMEIVPYGLYLGLLGVVLPPILFTIGMPHIGPGLGTILTSAELPIAVILSALVLTEQVSMSQWLGVVFILGGIITGNLKISKPKIKSSYFERESSI
jgi:drug/metabolite transporter (DMT)-like permease